MEATILTIVLISFLLIVLIFLSIVLKNFTRFSFANIMSKLNIAHRREKNDYNKLMAFIGKLVSVLIKMSIDKVGALIVIEKNDSLEQYVNIGNKMESEFLPELIYTIFYNKKSPLHDGAVIVRNWRIVSVSSYLPTSKKIINVQYGARHRAAFGICEKFDCFAFVVSETSGNITGVHLDDVKKLSNSPEKLTSQIIKMFSTSNMITFSKVRKGVFFKKTHNVKKN